MFNFQSTESQFEIKINGETLVVNFAKMHPTWITAHLRKAAQRFLNDKYSGEEAATKLDAIRMDLAEMHKGEPMPEKERKAPQSSTDPIRKLAREMATTFLAASLTAALGKDMSVWAKQDKLKGLFRFTDKGSARFDLTAVDQWMETNKAKRDYMAEAKAELDKAKAFNVDSDTEALFADLGL